MPTQALLPSTIFGWTFQGPTQHDLPYTAACLVSILHSYAPVEDDEVREDKLGRQFWELETMGIMGDDQAHHTSPVLGDFQSTIAKVCGRYQVALPWKFDPKECLGDNRSEALRRLNSLVRRLLKKRDLLERYDKAIRQYLVDGHAEVVPTVDFTCEGKALYYMPIGRF